MSWQAIGIWGQFFIIFSTCVVLLVWAWKQALIMQKIETENRFKLAQLDRMEQITNRLEKEDVQKSAQLVRIENNTTQQIAMLRAKTIETDQAVRKVVEKVVETDKVVQQVVESQPAGNGGQQPSA